VKWFNHQNEGEFIATDGGKEGFVHPGGIGAEGLEMLQDGAPVNFGGEGRAGTPHAFRGEKALVRLMENPNNFAKHT
jgi:cold shock CspA family protein